MSGHLPQKVALITGASRGIRRAIAEDLADDYKIAITYRRTLPLGFAPDVMALAADFSDDQAAAQAVNTVVGHHGRLDLIVHNAGAVAGSAPDACDLDGLRAMFDVNLLTAHSLMAAAHPHLKRGSNFVAISSVNAVLPPMGAALYGASKAALNTWIRGMAKELGPSGIRVNGVAPGAVNVPDKPRPDELTQAFINMTALGQLATPQDISAAVKFLASDAARAITGEVLTVSGGYRL